MNYTYTSIGLLLGCGVVLAGAWTWAQRPDAPVPPAAAVQPAPPPRSEPALQRSGGGLAALQGELAALKAELQRLKQRVDAPDRQVSGPPPAAPLPGPPSEAEMEDAAASSRRIAEEAAAGLQRDLDAIEAGFQAEPRDGTWAEQTMARIREIWSATQPPETRLAGLDCHASLCRLEIEFTGEAAAISSDFFAELALLLPSVVQQPPAQPDQAATVYYLARERFPSAL